MADIINQRQLLDFGKERLLQLKLYKVLDQIGKDYKMKIIDALQTAQKIATGDLIKSIDYDVIDADDQLILKLYGEFYLEYVANGRRPGAKPPPYRALIPWIKAKGIVPRNGNYVGMAIGIARNIGKRGIRPQPKIQQTIREVNDKQTQNEIANAVREDLSNIVERYFTDLPY